MIQEIMFLNKEVARRTTVPPQFGSLEEFASQPF